MPDQNSTQELVVVNDFTQDEAESDLDESIDSEEELDNIEDLNLIGEQFYDSDAEIDEEAVEPLFREFASTPKHMQCVAHKLQLVLKDAFEKDVEMINLKKVNFKLKHHFNLILASNESC